MKLKNKFLIKPTTMTHVNLTTSGVILTNNQVSRIREIIENRKYRSAWDRGVKGFALDLLESYEDMRDYAKADGESAPDFSLRTLLNGADSWESYCYGGMALIYDGDIARALCTPSQLAKTDYGRFAPNREENWMDVQVRAYRQAWDKLSEFVSKVLAERQ